MLPLVLMLCLLMFSHWTMALNGCEALSYKSLSSWVVRCQLPLQTIYCFFTAQHSPLVRSKLDNENGVYRKGVVSAVRNLQSSQASKQYIAYIARKKTLGILNGQK